MKHLEIPEMLASSSLPTEAERAHIKQFLDTSNDEISRLTAVIDKLVLEREALQRNVASYKAILAPIRLLNDDILREIFIHCLSVNKAAVITDAPLLLGRICRSWRELALSTPALWASIRVDFSHFLDFPRAQQLCQEAQIWLARSGTCPLTIRVEWSMFRDGSQDLAMDFIKLLTTNSTRWRSIEITAPFEWLFSLASLSETDAPRLEKFRLMAMYRPDPAEENLWQSLDILGGEQLRDLGLHCSPSQNILTLTSKVNFGQLTRLDLYAELVIYADILRRCPNLVTCRMSIANSRDPGIDNASGFEPLTLLHLSSLTIVYYPSHPAVDAILFETFFSNLNLPHLTSFSQTLGSYSLFSWLHLGRTSTIENLTLSLADLRDESILNHLRTSTSLKWLRINAWCSHGADEQLTGIDTLRRLMATNTAGSMLCPSLGVLELQNFSFSDDFFVELVRNRAALVDADGIAHLKVVHADFFRFQDDVDVQVISQLEDLIASGLSLTISYQTSTHSPPKSNIRYWPSKPVDLEWPI
ncbi:hypothetical protein C8J56DRAFT_953604 [Mycena floridula]|nr:hypothetical protein C8J56DRAFT_953604 [Mycena floridula]